MDVYLGASVPLSFSFLACLHDQCLGQRWRQAALLSPCPVELRGMRVSGRCRSIEKATAKWKEQNKHGGKGKNEERQLVSSMLSFICHF